MAQVHGGVFSGRQAETGSEVFWIWHDTANKTEVWIYDKTTSGYSWPSATNTSETLYVDYEQAAPPPPGNKGAFEAWVQNRSGLSAADLLVQVMTY